MFKRLYLEADADDMETIENFKKHMTDVAFGLAKKQVVDAKFFEETNRRLKVNVDKIEGGYRLVMDIDLS